MQIFDGYSEDSNLLMVKNITSEEYENNVQGKIHATTFHVFVLLRRQKGGTEFNFEVSFESEGNKIGHIIVCVIFVQH